ncbi:MAG: phosphatase PAP2 family protein [Flavobacteriales bacterium]|nr:phosphatase PAP2 family protein [Flavobacteriales bacterium]
MKEALSKSALFLIAHAIILSAGLVVIMLTDKNALHIWFNQWHSSFGDTFFRYATHMAEGMMIGFMIFIILIYKVRYAVAGLLGIVVSGLITQFLKRVVFNDHFRPSKVLEGIADLHFVDGVNLHRSFSFPSGHSTSAFALFFFLAYISPNKKLQGLCYALALITASSRVYLSQHFFEDVYVGSIMGTLICFASMAFFQTQSWGEKGLLANFETNRTRS